jgi:hypothetical protein
MAHVGEMVEFKSEMLLIPANRGGDIGHGEYRGD